MATIAESPLGAPIKAGAHAEAGSRFYFRTAVASFLIPVLGFAPTFWLPMAQGRLVLAPSVYLHAALFYAWTLLYMRQTWLVANGRTARHRELGIAGAALASGMLFVGIGAAISAMKRSEAAGLGLEARAFSIVPITGVLSFAVLVAVAIAYVRKPEIHKRLMLVATAVILAPAVARWFIVFLSPGDAAPQGDVAAPPPVFISILPAMLANCVIFAGIIHDKRVLGRVHPAYWIAGGCVLAVQILRVPLSGTAAWMQMADWIVALAP